MPEPIEYDGVVIHLSPNEPTAITLRRITDWIGQFSATGTPSLTVGMIYGMLRAETSRLALMEESIEDSMDASVEGGVEHTDTDDAGYIHQIINVTDGGTHIVNNYYYSESEKDGE